MLKFTKHAITRIQQRGKSGKGIQLVLRYGVTGNTREGIILRRRDVEREIEKRKRWLSRISGKNQWLHKALHRRIDLLQKMSGCVVVKDEDHIITVYDKQHRAKKRRARMYQNKHR